MSQHRQNTDSTSPKQPSQQLDMSPPTLETLPRELHLQIFASLNYKTAIALSQTNRLFHAIVSPQACATDDKQRLVRRVEGLRINVEDSNFGCYRCYRVLPFTAFADNQLKGPRGKNGRKKLERFCVACGIAGSLYTPGSRITQDGRERWFCGGCQTIKGERCCLRCGRCEGCLPISEWVIDGDADDCPVCGMKMESEWRLRAPKRRRVRRNWPEWDMGWDSEEYGPWGGETGL